MFHRPRLADVGWPWEPEAVPSPLAVVLAHQGGWDEALYVAVPMALLVGLLWVAQRRAQAEQDAEVPGAPDGADRAGHDER